MIFVQELLLLSHLTQISLTNSICLNISSSSKMDVFIIYILDIFTSLVSIAQTERPLGSTHLMSSTMSVYLVDRTLRGQREAEILS